MEVHDYVFFKCFNVLVSLFFLDFTQRQASYPSTENDLNSYKNYNMSADVSDAYHQSSKPF